MKNLALTRVRRLKRLGGAEHGKATGRWTGCHYQEKGMKTYYDEELLISTSILHLLDQKGPKC